MTAASLAAALDEIAAECEQKARTCDGAAADAERSADRVGGLNGIPGVEEYRRRTAAERRAEAAAYRINAEAARAGAASLRAQQ